MKSSLQSHYTGSVCLVYPPPGPRSRIPGSEKELKDKAKEGRPKATPKKAAAKKAAPKRRGKAEGD